MPEEDEVSLYDYIKVISKRTEFYRFFLGLGPPILTRFFTYISTGRPVHIICSPKEEYLGIITAYVPTLYETT